MGVDPYLDPASGVLRNLLGITDAGELARVEAALSPSRLVDLERSRLPGGYDLDHLRAFHRYILGDLYDWAGELRTVSIAKGSVFCLPQHLGSYGLDVFSRLAARGDQCQDPQAEPVLRCGAIPVQCTQNSLQVVGSRWPAPGDWSPPDSSSQ